MNPMNASMSGVAKAGAPPNQLPYQIQLKTTSQSKVGKVSTNKTKHPVRTKVMTPSTQNGVNVGRISAPGSNSHHIS